MKSLIAILILLFGVANVQGQWSMTRGPGYSGNSQTPPTLTPIVAIGSNFYCGSSTGGVYVSTDTGMNWSSVNSGLTNLNVTSLGVCGYYLFAGTGESGANGSLFRSTDGGSSWNGVLDVFSTNFYSATSSIVASGTNIFAANDTFGIFRSTDSGATWHDASTGLSNSHVLVLAANDDLIYAGTRGGGVFLSTNNGDIWIQVDSVLPTQISTVKSLAIIGNYVLAGGYYLWYDYTNLFFSSSDSGRSWRGSLEEGGDYDAWQIPSIVVLDSIIFVIDGQSGSVLISRDTGKTWLWLDDGTASYGRPSDPNSLLVADGFLFATDNGYVWRRTLTDVFGSSSVTNAMGDEESCAVYPNPATNTTTIEFTSVTSSFANIKIFNLLGQDVANLFDGTLAAGNHFFIWNINGVSTGTYNCIVNLNGQMLRVPIIIAK
jgi:photosystem II stability/assembly factor-like uncharacterized protein